jgi:hypothetical protein
MLDNSSTISHNQAVNLTDSDFRTNMSSEKLLDSTTHGGESKNMDYRKCK